MAADEPPRGRRRDDRAEDVEEAAERDEEASEQTPLLPQQDDNAQHEQHPPQEETPARRSLLAFSGPSSKKRRRWPSIIALVLLSLFVLLIILLAFLAPSTASQYAQQAVVLTPTSVSIASFTATGVRAHILADFQLDASRVGPKKPLLRNFGRLLTWFAREAESDDSVVQVSLPEYDGVVLGTALVPGIKVDLRNGHVTHVDFFADLHPGDLDGIRRIANDWVDGRLQRLQVLGEAEVALKSGLISLGKQYLQQEMVFANDEIPAMPKYNITKLNFRDLKESEMGRTVGMAADVSLDVANHYPLDFAVPPLAFSILVANCHAAEDPYIPLASALVHPLHVHPRQPLQVNVTGLVRRLSVPLTQDCPGEHRSPLDLLLGKYLHNEPATLYVRGAPSTPNAPSNPENLPTPPWLSDLLSSVTVPVALPGRSFSHLIRNFSLTETRFRLPSPFAEPDTPDASPRISANVRALVALPHEMQLNFSVSHVRADAEVLYHGKKMGVLDLQRWWRANSTRLAADEGDDEHPSPGEGEDDSSMLVVESRVTNVPLRITDEDVFAEVVQALLFGGAGGGEVVLQLHANVDVKLATALGDLVVRGIPAQGQVPVKMPFVPSVPGDGDKNGTVPLPSIPSILHPRISNLTVLSTTPSSLTIGAELAIYNPTPYSAEVPYMSVEILKNGSVLARATVRDLTFEMGANKGLKVGAVYAPVDLSAGLASDSHDSQDAAKRARSVGRELLSEYLSGLNTSVTVRMHAGSIPALPKLGAVLSRFALDVPVPRLTPPTTTPPGDDNPSDPTQPDDPAEDEPPHFIQDATMHLLSSTAQFTLLSPLSHTTLTLTSINATAYYHSNPIGTILYDVPFPVPPVDADGEGVRTPKLPVEWDLGGVGYEAVRRALGGKLRVEAYAEVGVRIGRWKEKVWFKGRGIGTRVGF